MLVCSFGRTAEEHLSQQTRCQPDEECAGGVSDWMHSVILLLEQGLVQNPIPYLTHIQDFRGKVQEVWAYYCCTGDKIPSRFFAMTSGRTV